MTAVGRRARLAAVAVVLVLTFAGTAYGDDRDFPFGPFRMFSTSTRPSGRVSVPELYVVLPGGEEVRAGAATFGLRRAELEGRYPRLRREPALLESLAEVYEDETGTDVDGIRLLRRHRLLEDRRVVGEEVEVLAEWFEDEPAP